MKGKSSSFELLHEKIQKWVWNQNWTSLKVNDIFQQSDYQLVVSFEKEIFEGFKIIYILEYQHFTIYRQ